MTACPDCLKISLSWGPWPYVSNGYIADYGPYRIYVRASPGIATWTIHNSLTGKLMSRGYKESEGESQNKATDKLRELYCKNVHGAKI